MKELKSEASRVGMEYFFKTDTINLLVEFVFGEKKAGDVQMGGTYAQPDFKPLSKVISAMMNQKDMIQQYNKQELV